MIDDMVKGTRVRGSYRILTADEIRKIFETSMTYTS